MAYRMHRNQMNIMPAAPPPGARRDGVQRYDCHCELNQPPLRCRYQYEMAGVGWEGCGIGQFANCINQ